MLVAYLYEECPRTSDARYSEGEGLCDPTYWSGKTIEASQRSPTATAVSGPEWCKDCRDIFHAVTDIDYEF